MSAETNTVGPFPEDATHIETDDLTFGAREAVLTELSVSFDALAEPSQWRALIQEMGFAPDAPKKSESYFFASLPPKLEHLHPYIIGGVSLSPNNPSKATWGFNWGRTPGTPPPENIHTSSLKVGEFPAVLNKLGALWPARNPMKAKVSATYLLDSTEWRLRFSNMRLKRVQTGERTFSVMPSRWRIEPPSGPVRKILRTPFSDESFKLTGQGHYLLHWTPHFLNEVDGAVWDGLRAFLELR